VIIALHGEYLEVAFFSTGKPSFANNCLLARRLVERGVRFVQVWHGEGQDDVEIFAHVSVMQEVMAVEAKEYSLCGRYLEPDKSFEQSRKNYRELKKMAQRQVAQNVSHGDRLLDFAEKNFANQTTTLVALLVANDRKADADRIAAEALKERDDPPFKAEMDKAKRGEVPAPWP